MVSAVVSGEECCSVDSNHRCVESLALTFVESWPGFCVV